MFTNVESTNPYYFDDFEISKSRYELSEEEKHTLGACIWMIDNRSTIRETAKNCDYAPTTFWRRIHYKCKYLSPEIYKLVCKQMHANLLFPKRNKKSRKVNYIRTRL